MIPCQNEDLVNTSQKLLKSRNQTFPAVRYLTQKLGLDSNIMRMTVDYHHQKANAGAASRVAERLKT